MPRQSLRGALLHFQQIGQGPDLVLIHGLFSDLAFWWLHIAPRLAETHRVTAMDLRGHGFSALSPGGYRAIDLADDVAALMDHLGIAEAHLVGHSFGGAVAAAAAARHPGRARRLTLVEAWLPSLQALPGATRASWPELQGRLRARGIVIEDELPRVAQGIIEELLGAEGPSPGAPGPGPGPGAAPGPSRAARPGFAEASPLWTGQGRGGQDRGGRGDPPRPGRALRRWRELTERTAAVREVHDPSGLDAAALGRIAAPADLVYGARSAFLPSRDGLRAALGGAREVMVPDAGHFFPILQPGAFLAAFGRCQEGPRPALPGAGAAR